MATVSSNVYSKIRLEPNIFQEIVAEAVHKNPNFSLTKESGTFIRAAEIAVPSVGADNLRRGRAYTDIKLVSAMKISVETTVNGLAGGLHNKKYAAEVLGTISAAIRTAIVEYQKSIAQDEPKK